MQGSVEGEVDAVRAFVYDVELDNKQLPQTLHSELDLSTARHGVRGDLDAALVSYQHLPVREGETEDHAAKLSAAGWY